MTGHRALDRLMRCTMLLSIVVLGACSWMPKQGDLVFQVAGGGDMSQAIVDATTNVDSLQFDHVAVFAGSRRNPFVVEASPEKGVVKTPWREFLNRSGGGVVVKRLDADYPKQEAVERALAHLGQPYDWYYLPGNGRTYCSELVEESYLYADSTRIFPAKPMRFRAADGTMPQFWTDLFHRLGTSVPEGVPGTNPNDMSRFRLLHTVRVFR